MPVLAVSIPTHSLKKMGMSNPCINYQQTAEELTEQTLERHEGILNDTGALCITTGKFTGRSPKDKFTVKDAETTDAVNWNDFNLPIDEKYFLLLKEKLVKFLDNQKEVWIRDC